MTIFWDGYGLDNARSGVFVHAKRLARELFQRGISPCLVTTEPWSRAMPEMDAAILRSHAPFNKFFESKLVWPLRTRYAVEKHVRKNAEKSVILHALSNLNLSKRVRGSARVKTVLTVHDLIPLLAPESVSKAYAWQFAKGFPWAVDAADRIVCVSSWTMRTLVERFPQARDKAEVILNGIDRRVTMPKAKTSPRNEGPLRLVCVSRSEPYKNLALLADLVKQGGGDLVLDLVTDAKGVAWAQTLATRDIRVHTNLEHEAILKLYGEADVYVHPSLMEGFCLPAAEALTSGTPVVYMAGSGIDEVAGGVVGFPMARDASLDEWRRRIEKAAAASREPAFVTRLVTWLATLPTWGDVADSLAATYRDLDENAVY